MKPLREDDPGSKRWLSNWELAPAYTADGEPVNVAVGLHFYSLTEVDEMSGTLVISLWIRLSWKDPKLAWDPKDFGKLDKTSIGMDSIWTPDVTLYNSVGAVVQA